MATPNMLGLTLILVVVTGSQCQQLDIWDLGAVGHMGQCQRYGGILPFPGVPDFEDPWFVLTANCRTGGGSLSCRNEVFYPEYRLTAGECDCNQGDNHELVTIEDPDPFNPPLEFCVGKVDAICTVGETSFIPQKPCVDNAHCVPVQGEGYAVGRCECLYGYKSTTNGRCEIDDTIEITTTEAASTTEFETPAPPPPEELLLPPLDLLIGIHFSSQYGDECNSGALLNRTYCASGRSISCIDRECQCNMAEDSIFDEDLNQCVGLAGSYCLARKSLFGWKACTVGADCFLEEGTSWERSSFGTCECLYGYIEQEDRTCVRDPSIPNPSTKRPPPTTTTPPPTTEPPKEGEPCDPHECKNFGRCKTYFRCDKHNATLVREQCGTHMFWNPLNPNGTQHIHGGNCDFLKNLGSELEAEYREDPECLGCFWKASGLCERKYIYQPAHGDEINHLELFCPEGSVFSEGKETCVPCQDVEDGDGLPCCDDNDEE